MERPLVPVPDRAITSDQSDQTWWASVDALAESLAEMADLLERHVDDRPAPLGIEASPVFSDLADPSAVLRRFDRPDAATSRRTPPIPGPVHGLTPPVRPSSPLGSVVTRSPWQHPAG
jgi:hypothetical protein